MDTRTASQEATHTGGRKKKCSRCGEAKRIEWEEHGISVCHSCAFPNSYNCQNHEVCEKSWIKKAESGQIMRIMESRAYLAESRKKTKKPAKR